MKALAAFIVGIALVAVAHPGYGHHPFSTEFDPNKTVTLKGSVTKLEWGNPHATLHMDVTGENGTTSWTFELGAPKMLRDFGWRKDTLKAGDQVTVNGWVARNAGNKGSANMITMSDGRKFVGGSSFFEERRTSGN